MLSSGNAIFLLTDITLDLDIPLERNDKLMQYCVLLVHDSTLIINVKFVSGNYDKKENMTFFQE